MVFIPILAVVLCSGWPHVAVVVEVDEASTTTLTHHSSSAVTLSQLCRYSWEFYRFVGCTTYR
jgi:hypothetical protein